MRHFVNFCLYTLIALSLNSCAKSVSVTANFPPPLVEPYPLTVGVRYSAELADFTYTDDPVLAAGWTIRLGEANVQMFRSLFGAMFTETIELPVTPDAAIPPSVDLIIEPKLEELEFTLPQQSGTDQFTVWLRYSLNLYLPDGQLIGNWRITAYGQEDQGDLGMGSENAMKEAAITALRDAAANIVLGFRNAPGLKRYIFSTNDEIADEQT